MRGLPCLHALPQPDIWCKWVDLEMQLNNQDRVKELFQRCLMVAPVCDLYTLYIKFMRRTTAGGCTRTHACYALLAVAHTLPGTA